MVSKQEEPLYLELDRDYVWFEFWSLQFELTEIHIAFPTLSIFDGFLDRSQNCPLKAGE